jgi:putative thioredoxin
VNERYVVGMAGYIDVTDESFQRDVIEQSMSVPVVVDLWAEWCGPCKTLGPIIERVVAATNGRVVLAKVDVDTNQRVAQAFKVQSIPAVYAVSGGKVVDSFIGALPESQVAAWVAKLAPAMTEADRLVELGDEQSLRAALVLEPGHVGAITGLAEALVNAGNNNEALALLEKIAETPQTRRIAAAARIGASAAAAANDQLVNEAVGLLATVKTDEAAKQRYLDLLQVMGDDPRVPDLRRKLATILF